MQAAPICDFFLIPTSTREGTAGGATMMTTVTVTTTATNLKRERERKGDVLGDVTRAGESGDRVLSSRYYLSELSTVRSVMPTYA